MAKKVTHEVDFDALRALIEIACGNRSYAQYSRDCGFRRELVSKILRKEYYPGLDVIFNLAKGSSDSKSAGFCEFMIAAGYGSYYSKIKNEMLLKFT